MSKEAFKMKESISIFGGRSTLNLQCVDALPTYIITLFSYLLWAMVERKMNTRRRNFLWLGNKERDFHLVKWKTVASIKKKKKKGRRGGSEHNQKPSHKMVGSKPR